MILFLGEAPHRNDGSLPLDGRNGRRLVRLSGLDDDEFDARVIRRNVLDRWPGFNKTRTGDAFPMAEAREAAKHIDLMPTTVALGLRVARALGIPKPILYGQYAVRGATVHVLPHPSGRSRIWNDPSQHRKMARRLCRIFSLEE